MTTPVSPYARILFVGSDLAHGSFAELFRQRLVALRGAAALVDTREGYAPLWQRVAEGERPLLVVDLEPQSSSAHRDWLRSELVQLAEPEQLFVAGAIGQSEGLPVEAACDLIALPELHLPCVGVTELPERHAWSQIPPHHHRVLLCNGPRCTRRGTLPLWKSLRAAQGRRHAGVCWWGTSHPDPVSVSLRPGADPQRVSVRHLVPDSQRSGCVQAGAAVR